MRRFAYKNKNFECSYAYLVYKRVNDVKLKYIASNSIEKRFINKEVINY